MKQLEKYRSFQELKSDSMSDSISKKQKSKIKDLYSQLRSAANSGTSSIQKKPRKIWILQLSEKQPGR